MPAAIVNCDWGTTRLRLRAVRLDRCQVTAEFRSLEGVAGLAELHAQADRPVAYRTILLEGLRPLIADQPELLSGAPILVSGMASSSIGWSELPYARAPIPIDGSGWGWTDLEPLKSSLGEHRVILISGVRSEVDVMRGEETELVGLFTLPQMDAHRDAALVIKPGTHSKHLLVREGRLVSFQTFMTGELFDVLGRHSILQHSVSAAEGDDAIVDFAALEAGVKDGSSLPLGTALFRVRTRQLLDGVPLRENRSYLSGVLLGSELGYLARHSDSPLVLCAGTSLFGPYRAALNSLGLSDRLTAISPEETELLSARGQAAIWARISSDHG